ncbi:MBL fold metallo-hydrolase [Nitratireductor alexandrii]|uniref:MBL fold metallo-hydrolase n=1 Tax=Nitratireductor alexandrii TaxID=2448161 RepID=UPI0013E0E396|nr:MBL fold metallo-hydrolase [Nitratireductor alexandrii]
MIETVQVEVGRGRPAFPVDILTLGQARIVRIPDIDRIEWPATALFDALTADDLRAAAGLVPAGTVDAEAATLLLSFNIYLIQTPAFTALIDAGIGNGKQRLDRPAWHRRDGPFLDLLGRLGVRPESVDIVVNTHLHADHVGWNTVLGDAGWEPTFPRARYVAPRAEFDHWNRLHRVEPSASVLHGAFADSVLPLEDAGCLDLVGSSAEIAPGLRFEPAAGHSPGMCVVRLTLDAASVLFTADVLHHPLQFARRELVSNFCADPQAARATRERILTENAGTGTILAPYHFASPAFGRLQREAAGARFVPLPLSSAQA